MTDDPPILRTAQDQTSSKYYYIVRICPTGGPDERKDAGDFGFWILDCRKLAI
jgi:hypothetical protein